MEKEIYEKYLILKDSKIADVLDDKELMKMASEIVTTQEIIDWIESLTDAVDGQR